MSQVLDGAGQSFTTDGGLYEPDIVEFASIVDGSQIVDMLGIGTVIIITTLQPHGVYRAARV